MNVKDYKKTLLENLEELSKFDDDEPVISILDEDGHPVFFNW